MSRVFTAHDRDRGALGIGAVWCLLAGCVSMAESQGLLLRLDVLDIPVDIMQGASLTVCQNRTSKKHHRDNRDGSQHAEPPVTDASRQSADFRLFCSSMRVYCSLWALAIATTAWVCTP